MAQGCEEYLRWAEIFSERLEKVAPSDLHKFARSLALTMLGHLPTKPGTCPFCIQYSKDRSCKGCGYSLTHGRCDSETSAFSRFIEAFQELGRAIYQDTSQPCFDPVEAKRVLWASLRASTDAAKRMLAGLPQASVLQLMEQKAWYLDRMIGLIPLSLLSPEVEEKCREVRENLLSYW